MAEFREVLLGDDALHLGAVYRVDQSVLKFHGAHPGLNVRQGWDRTSDSASDVQNKKCRFSVFFTFDFDIQIRLPAAMSSFKINDLKRI